MARVTLFDQASISPYSRFFWLENQVTVVGHGLQPDDYITFEAVETNAAPMAKNCGCDFVPAGVISLNSVLELTCTACNGVVSPVVLTAANPVVVLDHPQGFYLRAVYHGTGLTIGGVIVRATDTETRDLTDALRGCPERCPDYVGTLCITPGTRAFGVNDPRDPEATVPIMREGNIVGYIYPTPRSHAPVPVTEDPCQPCDGNTVGAIIGYAMPWDGPETECLCLCYECQDVSWEQVGDAFCRNDTLWVNEISNCGRTRERDTGDACCVPDWTNVGSPYCQGDNCVQLQQDGCGNTRTIASTGCSPACSGEPCVPNWTNVGSPYCVGDSCMQLQLDGCGNTRSIPSTGCSPECGEEPCVPNWTNVGSPYCQGDNCVQLQQDGCGNTQTIPSTGCVPECGTCTPNYVATSTYECREDGRYYRWYVDANNCGGANGQWQDVGPVTWTNNGEQVCDGTTNTWHQPEINQCGGTRLRDTGVPCEEPCVPSDWEDVPGAFRCDGNQTQKQQFNGCEYRWVDIGHVWEDTGAFRCIEVEGVCQYQKQERSVHCPSVLRYVTIAPCSWTPVVPPEYQCGPTSYQQRMENQCGDRRWDIIGPIDWTPTGEEQCEGGFIEIEEENQCGHKRWTPTTTPCGELVVTAPGCMAFVVHNWALPCNPNNLETAGPLGTGCSVSVSGGSGNYSYSWTHTMILDTLGVSVSDSGAGFSVIEMGSAPRRECPFQGTAQGASTVTVTDNVTGQTGSLNIDWVLEYAG